MTSSRYVEQNDAPSRYRRRSTGLCVSAALCLVWLAGSAFADTTPAPGNPIGPATMPPSSYERSAPAGNSTSGDRSSLMNLPGPMNSSGHLVMTGNVSGGKYFHGYVPYSSTTSFGAPLGSTQLDSFLRHTAVPPEPGEYASGYSPFYAPTGSAATTLPGYGGAVLAPASPRVIRGLPPDRPADVLTLSELSPYQAGAGPLGAAAYGNYDGSTSTVPSRIHEEDRGLNPGHESAIAAATPAGVTPVSSTAALQNTGLMTADDYRLQLEQLQRDIERVKANALALEQSLKTNDASPARIVEPQPAGAEVPMTPSGAVTLPQEQPSLPAGRVRPDEGLLLEPRVPDKTPVPSELQSVSGPRVTGVKWLPQNDQTAGVARAAADPFRAPLSAAPARPGQSSPASTAATGRIDAVFAPQGRPGGATGNQWTELPALQVQQAGPAVPGISNPPLGGVPRPALPPTQSVKPSPEQVSAFIARMRAASTGGNPAVNPAGSDPAGAVPDPSRQLIGRRVLPMHQNPSWTFGAPRENEESRVAASRPQALGMADASMAPALNSGTPGSLIQERFDRCLGAAELYLRQGRYYRAAELFTLAATYQPNDGRPLLGKSYALFGAGEYLSSALCLARALELDPRAVLGRSDLVNAIGGPAVFAARITDLEQCARTADVPQLQFLLAYVYSQMNRPAEAKASLAAAEKQLSPSPALDLLKAVVVRP